VARLVRRVDRGSRARAAAAAEDAGDHARVARRRLLRALAGRRAALRRLRLGRNRRRHRHLRPRDLGSGRAAVQEPAAAARPALHDRQRARRAHHRDLRAVEPARRRAASPGSTDSVGREVDHERSAGGQERRGSPGAGGAVVRSAEVRLQAPRFPRLPARDRQAPDRDARGLDRRVAGDRARVLPGRVPAAGRGAGADPRDLAAQGRPALGDAAQRAGGPGRELADAPRVPARPPRSAHERAPAPHEVDHLQRRRLPRSGAAGSAPRRGP
jgi:hypothetical protein